MHIGLIDADTSCCCFFNMDLRYFKMVTVFETSELPRFFLPRKPF